MQKTTASCCAQMIISLATFRVLESTLTCPQQATLAMSLSIQSLVSPSSMNFSGSPHWGPGTPGKVLG